jgi:hypothetical protein
MGNKKKTGKRKIDVKNLHLGEQWSPKSKDPIYRQLSNKDKKMKSSLTKLDRIGRIKK